MSHNLVLCPATELRPEGYFTHKISTYMYISTTKPCWPSCTLAGIHSHRHPPAFVYTGQHSWTFTGTHKHQLAFMNTCWHLHNHWAFISSMANHLAMWLVPVAWYYMVLATSETHNTQFTLQLAVDFLRILSLDSPAGLFLLSVE
jgi:hypothetical protein